MKYYIYTHSLNGVVFYIGSNWAKGNPNRAYEMLSRHRTKNWWNYVNANGGKENVVVEIIEYFDDHKKCINRELNLIEQYQSKGLAMVCREGNKGPKNGMYGTAGKNGNVGKVRTAEHKRNYVEACKTRIYHNTCCKCGKTFEAKGPRKRNCYNCS